jgi:hypothetical protein
MSGLRSRRHWLIAVAGAALGLVAVGTAAVVLSAAASDKSDAYEVAQEAAPAGDEVAATVNGQPVLRSSVRALEIMAGAYDLGTKDEAEVLDSLILQEVLRQEAERRGLQASDAEIQEVIKDQQQGFIADRASGVLDADISSMLEGLAKIGHPVESWDTDPVIIAQWAGVIAQSKLYREETADLSPEQPGYQEALAKRVAEINDRLMSEADIVKYPE